MTKHVWFSAWFSLVMAAAWGAMAWLLNGPDPVIFSLVVFLMMFGVLIRTESEEKADD